VHRSRAYDQRRSIEWVYGVLKHLRSYIASSRRIISLVVLALALAVLWQGARLVFRPDPRDDVRRADALFAAGRYTAARDAYTAIVRARPSAATALLRLGIVHAVRGEHDAAGQALAAAIGAGLSGAELNLARLYQGQLAEAARRHAEAARFWNTIGPRSALLPIRRALEAESLLSAADYAGAEAAYRAALVSAPPEWRDLAHARLALLRASSDPAAALGELAQVGTSGRGARSALFDWAAPLLPDTSSEVRQLAAALRAPATQRAQMLGQIYLRGGLYPLAEAQFAAVAPGMPGAVGAAAYAAYTRWSAGDHAVGLQRLEELTATYPGDARARALLALAYLSGGDEARARSQLEIARALAPRAPDTHLAWGQWYAVQHDYVAAAEEYARALRDAEPDQRAAYALALPRFHVETSFQVCEAGRPAAEEAARLLPNDAEALVALAATRVSCGDPAGGRDAAASALRASPTNAEASYYLGRALALLGERAAARTALVNAADLAPASLWRERAEAQIVALGL
jgi:tetratricopeptide (TPR) repeat protein